MDSSGRSGAPPPFHGWLRCSLPQGGCPPALSWDCVHTSAHLLIKGTVYSPSCPQPRPAGLPRTGKLVNLSRCSQGSRFAKTFVKRLQTSRQAKGLKATGVPKGSQNRRVPGRAGLHPVRAPPCPVHVLPGHRTKERPSSPPNAPPHRHPRGHRIGVGRGGNAWFCRKRGERETGVSRPDKIMKVVKTERFEMTPKDLHKPISLQHPSTRFPQTFLFQLRVLFLDQEKPRNPS